jgi:hypothetical protein
VVVFGRCFDGGKPQRDFLMGDVGKLSLERKVPIEASFEIMDRAKASGFCFLG